MNLVLSHVRSQAVSKLSRNKPDSSSQHSATGQGLSPPDLVDQGQARMVDRPMQALSVVGEEVARYDPSDLLRHTPMAISSQRPWM